MNNFQKGIAAACTVGSLLMVSGCEGKPAKPVVMTAEQRLQLDQSTKRAAGLVLDAFERLNSPKNCVNYKDSLTTQKCTVDINSVSLMYNASTWQNASKTNDKDVSSIDFLILPRADGSEALRVDEEDGIEPVNRHGKEIDGGLDNTYETESMTFVRAKVGSKAVAALTQVRQILGDPTTHLQSISNGLSGVAYGTDYQTDSTVQGSAIKLSFADFNPTALPKPTDWANYAAGHQVSLVLKNIPTAG